MQAVGQQYMVLAPIAGYLCHGRCHAERAGLSLSPVTVAQAAVATTGTTQLIQDHPLEPANCNWPGIAA